MKKLLLLFCSLLLVTGCGKPAATLPTVIGSGSVDIPAYRRSPSWSLPST